MQKSRQPSNRQLKVGETIKRELGSVLNKELHDPNFENLFLTVSEVRVSPDLRHAEAFVVAMTGKNTDKVKLIGYLNEISFVIRRAMNKKVALKYSPEIKFIYDDTFDEAEKINSLLND